ncbi:kinase-like domain-containing protein [Syncephalis fuscata]|nr:kinase-like domain-containing protein [Syncephalis fuscata]
MVTFSTDCWAPGMDLHVRRRQSAPHHRSVDNTRHRNSTRQNATAATAAQQDRALNSEASVRQHRRVNTYHPDATTPSSEPDSFNRASSSHLKDGLLEPPRSASTDKAPANPSPPAKKPGLLERLIHGDSKRQSSNANASANASGNAAASSSANKPFIQRSASSIQAFIGGDFGADSDNDDDDPFGDSPSGSTAAHVARANRAAATRGNSLARKEEEEPEQRAQLHKKYGICDAGLIGRGASAVVRLARRLEDINGTSSETLYAVKEFRKRPSLNHPNVVKMVDLVQDENWQWCEVMEYCPGGDLYHIIKSNCMTIVEINCCFRQLIQGIGYLHSMGVAHRDIKPENLLMDMHGQLKITDFGVSDVFRVCWEGKNHRSKGLCGSEPYIAPEEFTGREYDGRKVDIWACGIVYYAMRFQSIPFRQANRTDPNYLGFLERRRSGAFEPFLKLSESCRRLMYRILEPDTSKRITVEQILEDPWIKGIEVCTDNHAESGNEHHHLTPALLEAADQLRRYTTKSEAIATFNTIGSANNDGDDASPAIPKPRIEDRFKELRV